MSAAIKIIEAGTPAYGRLLQAAQVIQKTSGRPVKIQDCLWDASLNWSWTTVLVQSRNGNGWFMALSPAEQETILFASEADAVEAARNAGLRIVQMNGGKAPESYGEDKAALVRDLNALLRKVPALKNYTVQYGAVGPEGFVPLNETERGGSRTEMVMISKDGTDSRWMQSIAGDSLLAVFCDIARKLSEILY